jgi:hypothetical protein
MYLITGSENACTSLSWCGFSEMRRGDHRVAWMKATSFGLLFVLWMIFNLWGGFLICTIFPDKRNTLVDLAYITSMVFIAKIFGNRIVTALIVGFAYWLIGRSFSQTQRFALITNIIMFYMWGETPLAVFMVTISILRTFISFPTMYDINPCSMICGVAFSTLIVILSVGFIVYVIPSEMVPFFFFPFAVVEHEFSPQSTELAVSISSIGMFGFVIYASLLK